MLANYNVEQLKAEQERRKKLKNGNSPNYTMEQLKAEQEKRHYSKLSPLEKFSEGTSNLALGLGAGTADPYVRFMNLIGEKTGAPEVKVKQPDPSSTLGQIGKGVGEGVGLVAGGELLEGAGLASKALSKAPAAAKSMLAGSGLGALYAPKGERTGGALSGALIGGAVPVAVGGAAGLGKGIRSVVDYLKSPGIKQETTDAIRHLQDIKPDTAMEAKQMVSNLGGGKSISENSNSLSVDIANKASGIKKQYETGINEIKDVVGNKQLYKEGAPKGTPSQHNSYDKTLKDMLVETYPALPDEEIQKIMDKNILPSDVLDIGSARDLHKLYTRNPVFENAHNLQSGLRMEGESALSNSDNVNAMKIFRLQKALKGDIGSFLSKSGGGVDTKYNDLSKFYAEEYLPYKMLPSTAKITSTEGGKGVTDKQLLNEFKNPKKYTSFGVTKTPADKIANDLGQEGKNKILFAELGGIKGLTPDTLVSTMDNLDKTGLKDHVPKDFSDRIAILKEKMSSEATINNLLAKTDDKKFATRNLLKNINVPGAYGKVDTLPLETTNKLDNISSHADTLRKVRKGLVMAGGIGATTWGLGKIARAMGDTLGSAVEAATPVG